MATDLLIDSIYIVLFSS